MPASRRLLDWLIRGSRYLLALVLVVFGVDHLIGLVPIAVLIPAWIPWHVFGLGSSVLGLIAAGLSISLDLPQARGGYRLGPNVQYWASRFISRRLRALRHPGSSAKPERVGNPRHRQRFWGGARALTCAVNLWRNGGLKPGHVMRRPSCRIHGQKRGMNWSEVHDPVSEEPV
jgi:hypothetical protein